MANQMSDLKSNIAANYLGQGWRAIMSLAFVPLYLKYLGIEAYGLIGIFAVLQTSLSVLDVGMKPALGREMARYKGGAHDDQSIWNLLRSIEMLSLIIVIAVALLIWAFSGWLATDWVRVPTIPTPVIAQAFSLMGVVAALQFLESIYASSLAGLQRQVVQNTVMSLVATMRGAGAVGVLHWFEPSTRAFFVWQAICSFASLLVLRMVVYQALPAVPSPPRFSWTALAGIWRFAAGMLGITILALLLTQVDKILLSRLLTLERFGYYALAGVVSGALGVLVGPISAAYYPKFVELLVRQDEAALCQAYHQGAQMVTVIVGSAAVVLIVFSEQILLFWTGDEMLTQQVAPIISILALGSFFNCLMWVPYQMQLAAGWTSLTIAINAISAAIFVPLILWLVPIYGSVSAAWIWVGINGGYCVIGIQFMYRRMLTTEKWAWYRTDVMLPLTAACVTTVLARLAFPSHSGRAVGIMKLAIVASLALGSSAMAAPLLRRQVLELITRRFRSKMSQELTP